MSDLLGACYMCSKDLDQGAVYCGECASTMQRLATAHEERESREPRVLKGDPNSDPVNHPPHYTSHPSGVECISVTEHMNFCVGNAIKYLWRAGAKGSRIEDLRKARWYIDREITRLSETV